MHKMLGFIALVLVLVTGCVPPPPPSPAYEQCSNVGPYRCVLWYQVDLSTTSATGIAWTTEPPTFISIELTLERQSPDGSFTGIWIQRSGWGSVTQERSYPSALISCERGVYRWHMRAQFSGKNTTYWSTSDPFFQAGT